MTSKGKLVLANAGSGGIMSVSMPHRSLLRSSKWSVCDGRAHGCTSNTSTQRHPRASAAISQTRTAFNELQVENMDLRITHRIKECRWSIRNWAVPGGRTPYPTLARQTQQQRGQSRWPSVASCSHFVACSLLPKRRHCPNGRP